MRPEVPGADRVRRAFGERLGQQEIALGRFQHMLPGPRRLGVAQLEAAAPLESANRVRDQPVLGPVAAAEDVAGARRRQRDATVGEVGVAIAIHHSSTQALLAA